jgi:hypothetical protein
MNFRHGTGTFHYISGEVYEGEWKEDKREGWGVKKMKVGIYEGNW